ncbi:MAG: NAD(P)/FAD-dependent oxidoreductase [Chitinophagaceae bacterium]|nr:NAD(P)/FAD-dependent oxidoreductase [Chitinophagaceae bacterium]
MAPKVVIIGNGISGITCARHIRKLSNYDITVISAESKYFFSRTALMYIYMGHMKEEHTRPYENFFWKQNRINLLQERVVTIHPPENYILLESGEQIRYDYLVLATGSRSNKFGWPGQDLKGVQGLYSLQDLETMEQYTSGIKRATVVGGGLIGIETVEMLLSRNIRVHFLVREKSFWNLVMPPDESEMINKLIYHHQVDLRLDTESKEIKSDETGRVRAIITSKEDTIDCSFVALTVGVSPNIDFVKNSGIQTDRGIIVDDYLQTNFKNIFAIGDCAQFKTPLPGRKPIEQVWYTGKIQGETAARNIVGLQTAYKPGHWFNSAKFFDLEYQTYGLVASQKDESDDWFWWQDRKGERGLRLVWEKNTKIFKGLNAMGIRISHEVCNEWLHDNATIDKVVKELTKANFDPEFFKGYEKEFRRSFEVTHQYITV